MANLDISLKKVLAHEGANDGKQGYVNDKTDNGGETIAGISRKFHSSCDVWRLVDSAKKQPNFPYNLNSIPEINSMIANFYRANFWEKINGEAIHSQDIADLLMDKAVLEGIPSAIKRAQGIAGLPQTGVINNNLISKLNSL